MKRMVSWTAWAARKAGAPNHGRSEMTAQKVVLITGASSGVGRSTARLLSQRGYTVFGTSRHPTIANTAPVEMLPLDVREDDSVRACVDTVVNRSGRLDVLINNA